MICCSECTTPDECVREVWCFRRPAVSARDYVDEREAAAEGLPPAVSPYLAPEQVARRRAAELEHQAQDDANVEAFSGWFPIPGFNPLAKPGEVVNELAPMGLPPTWSVRRCLAAMVLVYAVLGVAWAVLR